MHLNANKARNGDLDLELVLDYPNELDEYKDVSGWRLLELYDVFCDALYVKYKIMSDDEKFLLNNITDAPIFTDLDDPEDFSNIQDWLNQDWLNHSWVDVDYMTDTWVQKLAQHLRTTIRVRRSC